MAASDLEFDETLADRKTLTTSSSRCPLTLAVSACSCQSLHGWSSQCFVRSPIHQLFEHMTSGSGSWRLGASISGKSSSDMCSISPMSAGAVALECAEAVDHLNKSLQSVFCNGAPVAARFMHVARDNFSAHNLGVLHIATGLLLRLRRAPLAIQLRTALGWAACSR